MSPLLRSLSMLLLLLFLHGAPARPVASPDADMVTVGSVRHELRLQPAFAASQQFFASEVPDLLNSPSEAKSSHKKKHKKNSSGKTNEGGFYKSYGSDADGEKGYLKKSFSNGQHGYKNYDTFHKKLGDKYGYEEHKEFGAAKSKDYKPEASHLTKHTKKVTVADHEGAGTDDVGTYAEDDGGDYYSEGDGEYYGGDDGGSSYSGSGSGEAEGYYSSGEGSAEAYSSDGSGEDSEYY